jgi:Gram-negative bacterial TonB protein C-terminal
MTYKQLSEHHTLRACKFLQRAVLSALVIIGVSGRSSAQEPQNPLSITPEQQSVIFRLAQNVREEIKKEDCASMGCEILVVNFALPSGETCSACMLFADSLSKALSELPDALNVINRTSFSAFLDEERIPSRLLGQHEALAWVGHQLHASRVVFGTMKSEKEFLVVKTRLLKDGPLGMGPHVSKEIGVKLPLGNLAEGLIARESFQPLAKRDLSLMNAAPLDASLMAQKNTKPPNCIYMPNPPYTQPAREAKASGNLQLDAIITTEGMVVNPRIVHGLPFGLNQVSMETVKTWKCNPALQNGVPIAVIIPFEMNFRLY